MSSDPEFERRINNQLATIAENQARFDERQAQFDERQAQFDERQAQFEKNQAQFEKNQAAMQEAIAGLIQVARIHNEQIEQQKERIDALIQIVEGHVTHHP